MPLDPQARRRQIKARLEQAEKTLTATRSSAGGHSRAVRLHLEREIHASRKDLDLLDTPPGNPCSIPPFPDGK
jgi:hypothetical protein